MALSAKRRLLAVKIESVYGTDPVPTGADAMIISNLDVSPAEASTVERDIIRPFYGQAEKLMSEIFAKATFEIELAGHGSGIIGAMPKIDPLLQACGFSGAQATLAISSLVRSGGTATATIGTHTYKVGQKASISGAVETEYNGTQTITAVTGTTISYAVSGTPTSPATGTPVMKSAYNYTPISDSFKSVTMYYNKSGVLHKITGARGNVSLDLTVKGIPKLKFEFTGINNDSSDASAFTPDFTAFTIPQVANTQNTTGFALLGYSGALEAFNFNLNNSVQYVTLVGKQYVDILDRKANGSMTFEEPLTADKNFWAIVKAQTTGALTITHGSEFGNMVALSFPKVLLDSPKNKESNNVMMLQCGVSIMPDSGNDEMTLSYL
ncbi:MAG: hypothetical protein ACXVB1_00270 [Pseudobdellovibrionaceae bacterium]